MADTRIKLDEAYRDAYMSMWGPSFPTRGRMADGRREYDVYREALENDTPYREALCRVVLPLLTQVLETRHKRRKEIEALFAAVMGTASTYYRLRRVSDSKYKLEQVDSIKRDTQRDTYFIDLDLDRIKKKVRALNDQYTTGELTSLKSTSEYRSTTPINKRSMTMSVLHKNIAVSMIGKTITLHRITYSDLLSLLV